MSERRLTDTQVQELAHHLMGTCKSLRDGLDDCFNLEEDDITIADCQALDDIVFCCVKCEWWHEMGEMTDDEDQDWTCRECAEESHD